MEIFKWKPEFSVKIELFDSQHRNLIDMINTLLLAMQNRSGDDEIEKIINRMAEYTQYHFSSEEDYMKKFDYPQMSAHIDAHRSFISEVQKFQEQMQKSKFLLSMKVYHFLKNWLLDHIQGMDKMYTDFFLQKGITEISEKEEIDFKKQIEEGILIKFDDD